MARADRRGGFDRRRQGQDALSDADTIVALSSGAPPAAIAIIRISGAGAFAAARTLAGSLPEARRAAVRALRDDRGELLDRALVLVFPGAQSATGEDLIEFHCHGGRAVVAAVERAVRTCAGVRAAAPGEFTRRALLNGRIDLVQTQGLGDLLAAETESERQLAVRAAEGAVSQAIGGWMIRLDAMAAEIEASIDFAEEGDVVAEAASTVAVQSALAMLTAEIDAVLACPPVERWRDGGRIVVAGPPNAGKSTLVNLLAQREAAIVSDTAGTTRDRIEVPVRRDGVGYVLVDTAGLRDAADDAIERIGMSLARDAIATADLIVWMGDDAPARDRPTIWVHARADVVGRVVPAPGTDLAIARSDPHAIEALWRAIARSIDASSPAIPLHRREHDLCRTTAEALRKASSETDIVLVADMVRQARSDLGALLGVDATERLLDTIFGRFCLGK